VQYKASPASVCTKAIADLNIAYEQYTFIDLGAGKGRALLVASAFPFKKLVGVEFARELANIARMNLRSCDRAEVICNDASLYEYPTGNLVVYMYNPFECALMERVMKRLYEAAESRVVYLIYLQPVCIDIVERFASAITPRGWIMTFKVGSKTN
jgi:predicted RNA methylase